MRSTRNGGGCHDVNANARRNYPFCGRGENTRRKTPHWRGGKRFRGVYGITVAISAYVRGYRHIVFFAHDSRSGTCPRRICIIHGPAGLWWWGGGGGAGGLPGSRRRSRDSRRWRAKIIRRLSRHDHRRFAVRRESKRTTRDGLVNNGGYLMPRR